MAEQQCPKCGVVEGAGSYCTACQTKTGPADVLPPAKRGFSYSPEGSTRPVGGPRRPQATEVAPVATSTKRGRPRASTGRVE